MTTSNAEEPSHEGMDGPALLEALLADKHVRPIESVDELADEGIFEGDDELDEFLSWVATERKADLA
ncbi:hypothetical protein [Prauserella flavalba]|uniref:Uncharacterized protein n=1 Tax=Prauserella flavalba TaxID=1477506 RepID=A0A318LUX2_9PSEU|nr:hypothetical protein [Prauserella flavalba]PXY37305.1 hypothetical protein BA062_06080 [Prauserella flavalba]